MKSHLTLRGRDGTLKLWQAASWEEIEANERIPALSRDRVNMDNVDSLAEVAVAMISDLLVLK